MNQKHLLDPPHSKAGQKAEVLLLTWSIPDL